MLILLCVALFATIFFLADDEDSIELNIFALVAVLLLLAANCASASDKAWGVILKRDAYKVKNGSGSVIQSSSGKKYLITNWHVCFDDGYPKFYTGINQDGTTVKGAFTKASMRADLCAFRVKDSTRGGITIAPSVKPTEKLHTRGYPKGRLGFDSGHFTQDVVWGYILSLRESQYCETASIMISRGYSVSYECIIQYESHETDLYTQPGSSGSPVVNDKGQLVGVINGYNEKRPNSGIVIKLEDVHNFMKGL